MRKYLPGIILILVSLSVLFLLVCVLILPKEITKVIKKDITERYNLKLDIASVSISFPLGVHLHNVSLSQDSYVFFAKTMGVTINLPKFLLKREREIIITWKHGGLSAGETAFVLNDGRVTLSPKINSIDAYLSSAFLPGTRIKFISRADQSKWTVMTNTPLKGKQKRITVKLGGDIPAVRDRISGKITVELENNNAKGHFLLTDISSRPAAEITIDNISVRWKDFNFAGGAAFRYSSNVFTLDNVILADGDQTISASGVISGKQPAIHLQLSRINIKKIDPGTSGVLTSQVKITGTFENPVLNIKSSLYSVVMEKPFEFNCQKGEVAINYANKTFNISGDILTKERYRFNGWFTESRKDNMPLYIGKLNLTGITDVDFEVERTNSFGAYTLKLLLRDLVLPKLDVRGNINVSGTLNTSGGFKLDGLFSGDKLSIKGFPVGLFTGKFRLSEKTLRINYWIDKNISGETILNFSKMSINGNTDLSDLPIERISGELSGTLDGKMSLSGDIRNPRMDFGYTVKNASFREVAAAMSGKGQYSGKKLVSSGKISIGKKINGRFAFNINDITTGDTSSALNFENINTGDLNDVLYKVYSTRLPIEGNADLSIELDGPLYSPVVTIKMESIKSRSIRWTEKILPAEWTYMGFVARTSDAMKTIQVEKLLIQSEETEISVLPGTKISFGKSSGNFDINYNINNLEIFQPLSIFSKGNTKGRWTSSGGRIKLDLALDTHALWVNQHNFKNVAVSAVYNSADGFKTIEFRPVKNRKHSVTGGIKFLNGGETVFSNFAVQETGRDKKTATLFDLDGYYSKDKIDMVCEGNGINIEDITALLNITAPVNGNTDFTVILKGNQSNPYLTTTVNISGGSIYSVPFTNTGIQMSYRKAALEFTNIRVMQLHRNKETLVITGSGKIPLDTAKPVNMLFQIEKGDLSFLETYSDIVKTSRGKIEGRMQITGNFQNPNFGGFILLSEGNIEAKSYFSAIKRLNAGITFDGNKLEIKEFSGKIGEGRFNIAGYLLMGKLFEIEEYNLAIETPDKKGLKIYIPELPLPSGQFLKTAGLEGLIKNYSSGEPHINVRLAGKKSDIKLTGYVRLDNTHFCYPAPAGAGKVNLASGILKDINMDMDIRTGENTWYENDLMSVNINGFLKLTGKLSKLMVNGKIEAVRGNINYINKVYEIREAVFEVVQNECFLEARAQTSAVFTTKRTALPSDTSASLPQEETKESGTVEMVIPRSNIGNIVPTFLSSTRPDMDSQKLIQATYGISGPHDSSLFMKQQLVRLFDSSLASPLARNFLRKSGLIDTAKVTYEPSSETSGTRASPAAGQESFLDMMKGTKYVLEKYLTGDLLLGYALTLNEIQRKLDLRHEFELAYRWKGNIFLRGIYGVEPRRLETNDWQIRVEPRWRFGGWGNDTQNDVQ